MYVVHTSYIKQSVNICRWYMQVSNIQRNNLPLLKLYWRSRTRVQCICV